MGKCERVATAAETSFVTNQPEFFKSFIQIFIRTSVVPIKLKMDSLQDY